MANELTFRLLLLAYYAGLIGINVYYGRQARKAGRTRTKADDTAVQQEGRAVYWLRRIAGRLMIVAVILYLIYPPFMASLAAPLPDAVRWLGFGVGIVSLPLLIWVQRALGRQWSRNLQLQDEHQLVTSGPYALVRHPMYSVISLSFLTVALIAANWLVIVFAIGSFAAIFARIRSEEEMMLAAFPDEYPAYKRRTGRLLPRLFG